VFVGRTILTCVGDVSLPNATRLAGRIPTSDR
jgi:hypothetical protein